MKHIDYQQAQGEGGVNSGQGFTGSINVLLGSYSWAGGGCKAPRKKSGRASLRAVGQTRSSQGQEHSLCLEHLPGHGGDCSDMMCCRP